MFRIPKILPLVFTLAAFAIFATGCGTDHSSVRLVHASADAPSVDVAVDGKTVVTDLAFGGLAPASGYITVASGNRRVEARTTATTTDLINSNVTFGSSKAYTMVVAGRMADQTIVFLEKTDDNSAPPSGSVKLRVIHAAAPSGPANLDIYVVAPTTDITNVMPTISALLYQQASDYQTLPAATYEVIMTDSTDPTKARLIDQVYTLTAGQIRTLVTLNVQNQQAMSATPLLLADLN
jgi:Domain of unknown function (DUF4397)